MGRLIYALAATCAVLAASPVSSQTADAGDPAEMPDARAIIEVILPPASREATLQGLMGQIADQYRGSVDLESIEDPGMRAIVERNFDEIPTRMMPVLKDYIPKLMEATAVAYSNEFNADELKAIRRFAETPEGAHYLSRSAALVGDPAVAAVNTQLFAAARQESLKMRDEMVAELQAYSKAHPSPAQDPQ